MQISSMWRVASDHLKIEPILLGCLLEMDPFPEFGLKEDGLSLAFRSSSSIRHIAFTKASTSSEPVSEPSQSFLHTVRSRGSQKPGAIEQNWGK
jgi:hypothetical protein